MSANVGLPLPLLRLNPWYPGQMGVPGTDVETGLRTHPTGAVFYVDPNYPGASDQRDGTNPDDPLRTVAAALTKCQAHRGDTIVVGHNSTWQYGQPGVGYAAPIQEAVTISVPGVRLVGLAQSSPVGVPWTPPATGGPCIRITAIDVLVEGFAFVGGLVGGTAIDIDWDGVATWGDSPVIRHCYFDGSIDTGILMDFVWNAEIHHCIFQECDAYGIRVDPAGSGIAYCRIYENWFINCATSAMSLRNADNCEVYHNRVFNSHAQAAAAATDEGIDTTGGDRNVVAQNILSCLRPVPAAGDYDDFCTAAATDAWVQNYLMNGPSTTNPT